MCAPPWVQSSIECRGSVQRPWGGLASIGEAERLCPPVHKPCGFAQTPLPIPNHRAIGCLQRGPKGRKTSGGRGVKALPQDERRRKKNSIILAPVRRDAAGVAPLASPRTTSHTRTRRLCDRTKLQSFRCAGFMGLAAKRRARAECVDDAATVGAPCRFRPCRRAPPLGVALRLQLRRLAVDEHPRRATHARAPGSPADCLPLSFVATSAAALTLALAVPLDLTGPWQLEHMLPQRDGPQQWSPGKHLALDPSAGRQVRHHLAEGPLGGHRHGHRQSRKPMCGLAQARTALGRMREARTAWRCTTSAAGSARATNTTNVPRSRSWYQHKVISTAGCRPRAAALRKAAHAGVSPDARHLAKVGTRAPA